MPARKQPVNIFACRILLALCFAIAIFLLFNIFLIPLIPYQFYLVRSYHLLGICQLSQAIPSIPCSNPLFTPPSSTSTLFSFAVNPTTFGKSWDFPILVPFIPNDFNIAMSFNVTLLVEVVGKQSVSIAIRKLDRRRLWVFRGG